MSSNSGAHELLQLVWRSYGESSTRKEDMQNQLWECLKKNPEKYPEMLEQFMAGYYRVPNENGNWFDACDPAGDPCPENSDNGAIRFFSKECRRKH